MMVRRRDAILAMIDCLHMLGFQSRRREMSENTGSRWAVRQVSGIGQKNTVTIVSNKKAGGSIGSMTIRTADAARFKMAKSLAASVLTKKGK